MADRTFHIPAAHGDGRARVRGVGLEEDWSDVPVAEARAVLRRAFGDDRLRSQLVRFWIAHERRAGRGWFRDGDVRERLLRALSGPAPRLRLLRKSTLIGAQALQPGELDELLDELPEQDLLHFIEIALVDQHDQGFSGVLLEVTDPDGEVHPLRTDRNGYAHLGGIAAGSCHIALEEAEPEPREVEDWLGVALFYKDGAPVAGAAYELSGLGANRRGRLDAHGRAMVPGVAAGSGELRFPELDTPTEELIRGVSVQSGQLAQLVATRPPLCMEVCGLLFETDKAFLLPSAFPAMRDLNAYYELYPDHEVHVTGHTDTTGAPDYNRVLSQERAEATAAFLRDDVDAWLTWYDDGKPEQKRWGAREDELMIGALPGMENMGPQDDPVAFYQAARGLPATGVADRDLRERLIREYMGADRTTLPEGTVLKTFGKGEDEPLIESGDEQDEPLNRRVEILFCEAGKPPPPPPPPPKRKRVKVGPAPQNGLRELVLIDTQGESSSIPARIVMQGQVLEVVPSAMVGNNPIDLEISTQGKPAAPPTWEVTGGAKRAGDRTFEVTGPAGGGWNPDVKPREYVVTAEVKGVNQLQAAVHAYPHDAYSFKVDFDEPALWQEIFDWVTKALDFLGGKFTLKKPRGKWGMEARWREHSDERAYYWFHLIGSIDPLIDFDDAKLTFGIDKVLKWVKKVLKKVPGDWGKRLGGYIEKIADAHVFVGFSGALAVDVDMERTGPGEPLYNVQNNGKGLIGKPTMSLGILISAFDDPHTVEKDPVVSLSFKGEGEFHVDANPFVDEEGVGLDLTITFTGITLSGEASVMIAGTNQKKSLPDTKVLDEGTTIYGPQRIYVHKF